jgi:hypothetical protein
VCELTVIKKGNQTKKGGLVGDCTNRPSACQVGSVDFSCNIVKGDIQNKWPEKFGRGLGPVPWAWWKKLAEVLSMRWKSPMPLLSFSRRMLQT